MKKCFLRIAALCSLSAALLTPARAATIIWEGQTWTITGTGASAGIDGSGDLVLTKGSSDANIQVSGLSGINQFGTPHIDFSYMDPGPSYNVDIFIQGSVANARLQAGSLFTFQGLGYARFGTPAQEQVVFVEGSGLRAAGQAHSLSVGQRQDGTIDYVFDGAPFTTAYLKDNVGPFAFNTVLLRMRGGVSGGSVKFTSLASSDSHIAPGSEVPEPGTMVSLVAGLGLLALLGRKSWQKARR